MSYLFAWLIAWSASFGIDPDLLAEPDGAAPALFMPPPPQPPASTLPTGEQAPPRPTKPGNSGQNDIYNGF